MTKEMDKIPLGSSGIEVTSSRDWRLGLGRPDGLGLWPGLSGN